MLQHTVTTMALTTRCLILRTNIAFYIVISFAISLTDYKMNLNDQELVFRLLMSYYNKCNHTLLLLLFKKV